MRVKRDFYLNFLEALSPKLNISMTPLALLYRKYGIGIFYFIFLMSGVTIKMPSQKTLINIIKKVRSSEKEYPEYIELELPGDFTYDREPKE